MLLFIYAKRFIRLCLFCMKIISVIINGMLWAFSFFYSFLSNQFNSVFVLFFFFCKQGRRAGNDLITHPTIYKMISMQQISKSIQRRKLSRFNCVSSENVIFFLLAFLISTLVRLFVYVICICLVWPSLVMYSKC